MAFVRSFDLATVSERRGTFTADAYRISKGASFSLSTGASELQSCFITSHAMPKHGAMFLEMPRPGGALDRCQVKQLS